MAAVLFGRMHGNLGRWKREDQPAAAGVDMGKFDAVAQKGTLPLRSATIDDRVGTDDHVGAPLRAPTPGVLTSFQISSPIATAVSIIRLEKPHSLSYHDNTATI